MNGITHKQAKRYMLADLDGRLTAAGRLDLETHLHDCEACRAESESFATLTARLHTEFHSRWDAHDGPSVNVMNNIRTQSRRITMKKQFDLAFNIFGGVVTVLVVVFVISSIISQFQKKSIASNGTQTNVPTSSSTEERLIAFTSEKDGNSEIYTMKSDGGNLTNLTNDPAFDGNPNWSPDGSHIVFESARNGNSDIYIMNYAGSGLTRLTNGSGNNVLQNSPSTYGVTSSPWSPDGSHILFSNDQTGKWSLYVANVDGSNATQLSALPVSGVVWSPDGKQVAYANVNKIIAINIDGTNRRELVVADPDPSIDWHIGEIIAWSQDERSLYFSDGTSDGNWHILRTATDGIGIPEKIAGGSSSILEGGWLASDSTLNYISDVMGGSMAWRRSDGKFLPWDYRAICVTSPNGSGYYGGNLAASHEGSQALLGVTCSNKGSLYFLDLNTKTFNQIAQFPDSLNNLTVNWSADDSSILMTGDNPSTNKTEIYLLSAEELLKKSPAPPTLIWSGENINPILQPVPYHGAIAELPKPATPALKPTPVTTPLWSDTNNGDLIAFTSNRPGSSGIYITKSDGSQTTYLANLSGGIPVWSPDGNYIAFSQFQNNKNPSIPGKNALYVAHPDGSNMRKLADDTWLFAGSPDSQKMAYLISEPQKINSAYGPVNMTIQIVNLDGSVLQTIDVGTYSALDQLRWSSDGQTLYYTVSQLDENDGTAKESSIYQITINEKIPVLVVKSDKRIDEWTGTRSDLTYLVRDIRGWNLLHTDGKNETAVATWTENSCASNNFGWSAETTAKQWSPDGKYLLILFSCSNSSDTWLYVGSKDGKFTQLLNYSIQNASYSSSDPYNPNAWSSDSQYIVFASDLEAPGNRDIYVLNVQAALKDPAIQPVRLTTSGFGESYPAWQPKP